MYATLGKSNVNNIRFVICCTERLYFFLETQDTHTENCYCFLKPVHSSSTVRLCPFSLQYVITSEYLTNFLSLTFRGPCVMIYSYNKTSEMH